MSVIEVHSDGVVELLGRWHDRTDVVETKATRKQVRLINQSNGMTTLLLINFSNSKCEKHSVTFQN